MNHLVEWEQSGVDDQLTRLNVTPLEGASPLDYLLYSDQLPRRNDGRVGDRFLKRYEHTEQGGWWCSGINIMTGEADLWGCFKPEQPRLSPEKNKPIKYEHPPKAPTGVFALRVPLHIWQRIAARYGVDIEPQQIDRTQPDLGFWQWFIEQPSIPLCLTEGAKKAGALLTAGYAAVALPGINSGYRVPRDEQGNRTGRSRLIPQLKRLAQAREIYLVFDQDSKPNTVKAVEAAIRRMGYLLNEIGCSVKVITWNAQLGKGVDDLIATGGQTLFDEAYQQALTLDTWKAQSLTRLTYTPNIALNCRYLPQLSIPDTAKLVGIKSPKGTGKTHLLESVVAQALAKGQQVLVIGHRVRLVEALCQRFGLNYVTEVRSPGGVCGYGLCIDSLHPTSQANFNADRWSDAVVIIDEVEQVLWHGLNSDTCKGKRVAILKSFKTLLQNVFGGEGQVFVADADLSNTALEYLMSLAGVRLEPFVIQNDWKPSLDESWRVYSYPESTPKRLVKDLERHIREGGKPFVCLSAQKLSSQWGTCSLEAYLQKQFPKAKILRIDSESLAEPSHPAYGCMNHLHQTLADYDVVLASPSIETGISIDLKEHFTSVWSIAQGVQTANSVCQALGRIRANLPRYIWVAAYGFNQVGNGSTSIPALLTSGQRLTQLNIRLLQQSDFEAIDDLDTGFQAESLLCWAKMAVRVNASMGHYRESVLAALREEGHQVIDAPSKSQISPLARQKDTNSQNQLSEAITAVREQNYQAQCEAIACATALSNPQYQTLKKQLIKSIAQKRALRKYDLNKRYGVPVTAKLVAKDDQSWYQKLRIHYFLTLGRSYLAERDAVAARMLVEQGGGSLFLPDFNGSQLGAAIGTMEVLGIPILLQPGRELKNTDEDLKAMAQIALTHRTAIKTTVGIGIAKTASPITIIRRFLDLVDYELVCLRSEASGKKRVRVYQAVHPDDGREQVFWQWLAADSQHPGCSEFWQDEALVSINNNCLDDPSRQYRQLSLEF